MVVKTVLHCIARGNVFHTYMHSHISIYLASLQLAGWTAQRPCSIHSPLLHTTQIYWIWHTISNLDRITFKFLKYVNELLVLNVPTTYLQYQVQTLPHNQWYFWNLLSLGVNAQSNMGSRNYICRWLLIPYRISRLVWNKSNYFVILVKSECFERKGTAFAMQGHWKLQLNVKRTFSVLLTQHPANVLHYFLTQWKKFLRTTFYTSFFICSNVASDTSFIPHKLQMC
jgi:hypothetical protein